MIAVTLSACGWLSIGTATHDVYLTNTTGEQLTVYELVRRPGVSRVLEAGATIKSSWPYPLSGSDSRRARLEADTSVGARTYCKDFSWDDLTRLGWRIRITSNTNECE